MTTLSRCHHVELSEHRAFSFPDLRVDVLGKILDARRLDCSNHIFIAGFRGSPKASRWRSNRWSTGKHHHRQNAYAALGCRIALAVHSGRLGKDGKRGGAILRCVPFNPCDRCC